VLFVVGIVLRHFFDRWGPSAEVEDLPIIVVRILFLAVVLRLVWAVRRPIAALIRGNGESLLRRTAADVWTVLMTLYAVTIVLAGTVEELTERGFRSPSGIRASSW
jgi:hypothetical protein